MNMNMIFSSDIKVEVGSIFLPTRMSDNEGNYIPPQPLYIVREATWEEYKAQSTLHQIQETSEDLYYYEISTD